MSIPATFNIAYYRGDTYEFYIRPKDQDGIAVDLSDFTAATFTIGDARGSALTTTWNCTADIEVANSRIHCVIDSTVGSTLTEGVVYVYDVQVHKDVAPDPEIVYTYLTGTVSVTGDVSSV